MIKHAPEWTTSVLMLRLFQVCAVLGPENNTYFHERFYRWLTDRAEEAETSE